MVLLEDETVDESAIEQELSRLSRAIRGKEGPSVLTVVDAVDFSVR